MDIADAHIPWVLAFFGPPLVLAMLSLPHLAALYMLAYCIAGVIIVIRRTGK